MVVAQLIPNMFWDVVMLLPLGALAAGTTIQAQDSINEIEHLLPEEDLFLIATYMSRSDARSTLSILFGSHGRGREDLVLTETIRAYRAAQGWLWLRYGAIVAFLLQAFRVINVVQSEGLAWWILVAIVGWTGLSAWRATQIRRGLLQVPHSDGFILRRRTLARALWTVFPFLPCVDAQWLQTVRSKVIAFLREADDYLWPYWLSPLRTVEEPTDSRRLVILISPAVTWTEQFSALLGEQLRMVNLDPKRATDYQSETVSLMPRIDGEAETRGLERTAWLVRFTRPRDLFVAVAAAEHLLQTYRSSPSSYPEPDESTRTAIHLSKQPRRLLGALRRSIGRRAESGLG